MTIDLSEKKTNFIKALANVVVALDGTSSNPGAYSGINIQQINNILSQWNAMGYASGGNVITDGDAAAANPAYTALIINNAIGALTAIQTTYNAQVGYLEPMRP